MYLFHLSGFLFLDCFEFRFVNFPHFVTESAKILQFSSVNCRPECLPIAEEPFNLNISHSPLMVGEETKAMTTNNTLKHFYHMFC